MYMQRWLCSALSLCATTTLVAREPDFPVPEHTQVSKVADTMLVAGRNTAVRAFVSDDSVADIVKFYQDAWHDPPAKGAPGYAYDTSVIAPWKLLTRVEDGYVMTVQVMEHQPKGSFGFLASGHLSEPGAPAIAPPEPPSMHGSKVLSNISSKDAGKDALTSMLVNQESFDSNVNFYRTYYQDWRTDLDQVVQRGKMHALGFTHNREQVVITIQSGRDGSHIVVNSVTHDLLGSP